jgi:hypothetical protein
MHSYLHKISFLQKVGVTRRADNGGGSWGQGNELMEAVVVGPPIELGF